MGIDARSAEKLIARISETFDELPSELRKAARYVTSNPSEVAFRSMRTVATAADVSPATMVRLAKALGLRSFEELREAFQTRIQARPPSFSARAREFRATQSKSKWVRGIHRVISEELSIIQSCVEDISDQDLETIGGMFTSARRIYVMGLRGMYPAAFFFHYSAAMFSDKTVLVAGDGGTHLDAMRGMGPKDVALLFTCRPYPTETVRAVRFAHRRGVKLVAVTDGPLSPAARAASVIVNVKPIQSSLLSAAAANVVVARVLAAVFLSVCNKSSVAAIRSTDQQFAAFEVYETK
jgi:DNA-binding MurR/RpiR family transcriptional regulator